MHDKERSVEKFFFVNILLFLFVPFDKQTVYFSLKLYRAFDLITDIQYKR